MFFVLLVTSCSTNSNSNYYSKDLQTFGLRGKVRSVNETTYKNTDSEGFQNSETFVITEMLEFTSKGEAKLKGKVERDSNGFLSSYDNEEDFDTWESKQWTYSSTGDLLVCVDCGIGGCRENHYLYDSDGYVSQTFCQGTSEEGGEYDIKTYYTIQEKDEKGNWTRVLVKEVYSEGDYQATEYSRIVRNISYDD